MNAIGADQKISRSGRTSAMAIRELDADAVLRLPEARYTAASPDCLASQPLDDSLVDEPQEPATMDADLRVVMSRIDTPQFTPDDLAEAVGIDQFVRADTPCVEVPKQSKLGQFLDCMWQHVDADPEFADIFRALEYFALNAGLVQEQGGRQASYAAADD
jgi:hypothetical protein